MCAATSMPAHTPNPATTGHAGARRIVVLCPMQIERRAVEKQLVAAGLGSAVQLIQAGIGKEAIVAAARAAIGGGAASGPTRAGGRDAPVMILAGACGALKPVEDVPPIARVIDEHGGEWRGGLGFVDSGRTLIAVDRIVSTPTEKRALADDSGAAIVDMESHAFAAECERLGAAWTVVRGVSDSPEESLPAEVLGWVTPGGDTRSMRAAIDMVCKPRLIPHIARTLRRSGRVLPRVGARVVEVVRWLGRGGGG